MIAAGGPPTSTNSGLDDRTALFIAFGYRDASISTRGPFDLLHAHSTDLGLDSRIAEAHECRARSRYGAAIRRPEHSTSRRAQYASQSSQGACGGRADRSGTIGVRRRNRRLEREGRCLRDAAHDAPRRATGGGDGAGRDVRRRQLDRAPLPALPGSAAGTGGGLERSRRRSGCGLRVGWPASAGAGRAQGCHDRLSIQHSGR